MNEERLARLVLLESSNEVRRRPRVADVIELGVELEDIIELEAELEVGNA